MEIKNFNIYNAHANNANGEGLKKKKLHKKTISCLNSAQNLKKNATNLDYLSPKISQKEKENNVKKVRHVKAKSQENLKTNAKEWGKLLAQYGKNVEKEDDIVTKFAFCNRCGFCP